MTAVPGQGTAGSPEAPSGADRLPPGERVRPGALSALLHDLVRADRPVATAWVEGLQPGRIVGRFELVRELGRGGFGVVYEARDVVLGRSVAFKAVRMPEGAALRHDRLLSEAEAAARLSHPNIVTLHDVGRCDDGPYLVLELLRGRTLEERLEQGPIAPAEAVRIALEVAKGLAHAHEHGVVHRDVTPGNIYLCDDGQVKILDLGMAHAFGRRKVDGGTPAYMAPEQREGAPEDERTDVFALGVVLYRMIAGELPRREPSRPGRTTGVSVPPLATPGAPALASLVKRTLQRDPVQRPRDAGAVRDALSAIHQELLRAPPATVAVRVRRRPRASAVAAATLVALAAAGLVAYAIAERRASSHGLAGTPSVAVLPFADMSAQKNQEYFSDGLAEEILNALAQVPGLHVAGRTSSFAFKGTNGDLRAIGRQLHVSTVLEGSVRTAGSRVRITAQLINLSNGYHLWSQTFDRELTDVLAIEDEIARSVVAALRLKLLPPSNPAARPRPPARPEAYTEYLLGRQWYARYSVEGFRRAADAFEKAIALDPAYGPAWAGLAVQLYSLSRVGHPPPDEARALRDRAVSAAERAVALDPELAEAYSARGYLRAVLRRDWRGAQDDLDRARALSPGDATSQRRAALVDAALGRTDEAIDAARRATELDPLFPSNWMALEELYLRKGDVARARLALERVREIAPEYVGVDEAAAYLLLVEGDPAAALSAFRQVKEEVARLGGVAMAQHALGHVAESSAAIEALIARYGDAKQHEIALVYAMCGDADHAFEWLERASADDPESLVWAAQSPALAKLHGDPRYTALLRKLDLPGT